MAVKMRLRRMGAKKKPFYRIVVADSRSPRDGRCIAEIGTYDPNTDAPSDMGKVIGKQGRIAKAIRSVVKAAASKEDRKVVVDIQ